MKISDGICAYVAGGVGNQLFMLAAAWEQSERLGVPLYVDTSHFSHKGTRAFQLEEFTSPAIMLKKTSPWTSIRVSQERIWPFPKKFNPLRQSVFFEKDVTKFDSTIYKVKPGTTLLGYFQSPLYFEKISPLMRESIQNFSISSDEQKILGRIQKDPRITLHLRRGDYLLSSKDKIHIAGVEYAKRSFDLLTQMGIAPRVRVFSDSPELVRTELSTWDADFEIFDENHLLSDISTLKAMASGTAFIMSNSSFSWWGAWMMNQLKSELLRPVIAPRPWTHTGESRNDMLEKTWITLDSRN